jgi:hypothetical protein
MTTSVWLQDMLKHLQTPMLPAGGPGHANIKHTKIQHKRKGWVAFGNQAGSRQIYEHRLHDREAAMRSAPQLDNLEDPVVRLVALEVLKEAPVDITEGLVCVVAQAVGSAVEVVGWGVALAVTPVG